MPDKFVLLEEGSTVVLKGRFGWYVINKPSMHGKCISFYGEHAQNELNFLNAFLRDGQFVIDVGAHQGAHSLFFAKQVGPQGRVISIEPQRVMAQYICATLTLNNIFNVHVMNVAAGSTEGWSRIEEFDYHQAGAPSQMKIRPENSGEFVRQVAIDGILESFHISRSPSLIKIDVEGMEDSVLEGAAKTIERCLPVIYFECRPESKGSQDAISRLKAFGYRVYLHQPAGFNPSNYFAMEKDIFGGGKDCNAIALPHNLSDDHHDQIYSLKEV